MGAVGFVGNSLHGCVRKQVTKEVEFGGAGLAVAARYGPDRAAVEVDSVVVVVDLVKVGKVALRVEQFGQNADSRVEGPTGEFVCGVLHELASAPVENPVDEMRVFLLDVFEQLKRQAVVCGDKQRLGAVCGVVAVGRASGLSAVLASVDQAR